MVLKSQILGYFLLDYLQARDTEGHADTSLENLITHGHQKKLPFLNRERFQKLKSEPGMQTEEINSQKITDRIAINHGWSPTGRFLYQITNNGRFKELNIPQNSLLISTNRKTIQKIIEFGRDSSSGPLLLKTKMKGREYGNELFLSFGHTKHEEKYYSSMPRKNDPRHGSRFNSYLVNDNLDECTPFLLFSIHCLQVGNVCFIYEAEIDAIERHKVSTGDKDHYSIIEMKTNANYQNKQLAADFYQYREMSKQIGRYEQNGKVLYSKKRGLREFYPCNKGLLESLLQGELGNATTFMYGFQNSGWVTAQEFPCFPGTLLELEKQHLEDFVSLLQKSRIAEEGALWDTWQNWEVTKDRNSSQLCNSTTGYIIAYGVSKPASVQTKRKYDGEEDVKTRRGTKYYRRVLENLTSRKHSLFKLY